MGSSRFRRHVRRLRGVGGVGDVGVGRWWAGVVAVAVACGPQRGETPDPEALAPVCNGAPPGEPCPEGCVEVDAWRADPQCGLTVEPSGKRVCVALSEDPAPEPSAAYYREVEPGEVRFVLHGQGCSELSGVPVGWTECAGVAGEPPECFCFERRGVNPWEEAKEALDACGLPEPCPLVEDAVPPYDDDIIPDYSPERRCMFEARRDGVDGLYRWKATWEGIGDAPDRITYYWNYVVGDEVISLARGPEDDPFVDECGIRPRYDSPASCMARDSAVFETCLETTDLIEMEMCLFASVEVTPCEFPVEPVCPGT